MTRIDDTIGEALDADDRAFLERLDRERGLFTQLGDVMAGPLGGWAKLMFAVSLVLGAGMLFAGWQFFTAQGDAELTRWGLITLAILLLQGFAKEWFFARMNMLTILREIKRAELRIAMNRDGAPQ